MITKESSIQDIINQFDEVPENILTDEETRLQEEYILNGGDHASDYEVPLDYEEDEE